MNFYFKPEYYTIKRNLSVSRMVEEYTTTSR